MPVIERLSRERPISVRIAQQVLALIEAGSFAVGTKLPPEMELARKLGVSRPSVREALGALQFAGHVVSVRGSGTWVTSVNGTTGRLGIVPSEMTTSAVVDLFEARLLIEPQVAALAAVNPVAEKVDDAEAVIEGMRLVVDEQALHVETDLRVHRAIAEACPNHLLRANALELINLAGSPALKTVRTQAWDEDSLLSLWSGQHHAVLHAIKARDPQTAAETTWAHLMSAVHGALDALNAESKADEDALARLRILSENGPWTNEKDAG